jgi:leucyl aminopeptidase
MRVSVDGRALHRVRADLVVLLARSGALGRLRRERVAGVAVVRELTRRRFTAEAGTASLIAAGGHGVTRHLAVIGLGADRTSAAGRSVLRQAGAQIIASARDVRARTVAVGLDDAVAPTEPADALALLVEGVHLAAYRFAGYRSEPPPPDPRRVTFTGVVRPRERTLRQALRSAEILARATNSARTWINEPASVMTPAAWASDVRAVAGKAGLAVRIDGPKAIAKLGMGALLGVARGSGAEPRFIRLTYRPPGRPGRPLRRVALVGKGVTFDSGGLSLKSAGGMETMKRDMSGGAAVLGAMLAIAKLRPAVEVRAYVPATENMPGAAAMKPGDVLRTAAGRTIEVLNTDAEGRLVLADALAVALGDAPDVIVDIATLTGAVRAALGTRLGGVMGTDATLVRQLVAAGEESGERLWELPLVEAYRANLDSPVADICNIAATPNGGAIHAGLFLREFVGDVPWAHLDIAGVAFTDRDLPGIPRGGVGFGVRLLTRWVCNLAANGTTA